MTLGIIGILCLALGFAIPILPTIAAFVLGLIGASSAKRHDNSTGLIARASRGSGRWCSWWWAWR